MAIDVLRIYLIIESDLSYFITNAVLEEEM